MEGMKAIRNKKGLTQRELSEKVGCSTIMIQSLEQGLRNGSLPLLKKIAEVLECNIDDLL